MGTTSRIPCYDQMKAVAIIMVIMGHVLAISFGVRDTTLGACIGTVHLNIFFMVSGYFAYKASGNTTLRQLARGLLGKTRLLMVPLVAWGALWCVASGEDIVSFCHRGGGDTGSCGRFGCRFACLASSTISANGCRLNLGAVSPC